MSEVALESSLDGPHGVHGETLDDGSLKNLMGDLSRLHTHDHAPDDARAAAYLAGR